MRAFIALNLPEEALNNLEKMQYLLARYSKKGTLIPRKNLHLTLRFLGEISTAQADNIAEELEKIDVPMPQGSFSMLRDLTPSVICAEMKQRKDLSNVEKAVSAILSSNGFESKGGKFLPHVTIMRNYAFDLPFFEIAKNIPVYNKPFYMSKITLYQSILTPKGAIYQEMASISLKEKE